jgi:hypothetical protein
MNDQQVLLLNNKKSKKVGYKRRDALVIAQQIRQYLADLGILLPHTSDRLFGRAFKVSEGLKTHVSNEVMRGVDLRKDANHLAAYYDHTVKVKRKGARATVVCELPLSFDQFTQKKYKDLKIERIKQYRREHEEHCADQALRTFVDRETGELLYDDYGQLARAYYALYQCSPATYAIFKNPDGKHYSSQGITFTCSKHRIDPVWNYVKSKKLRSAVHSWMKDEQIHERFQPMHLVLTVPHPDGVWMGKKFYAKEMIQRFNIMRKSKGWNKYIYGGLQCLEITRKGKNGLHIHIHAMVLQRPEFDRNEVYEFISSEWQRHTGAIKCWYETLYVHKRVNDQDKKSAWICELDDQGRKIWDDDRQEYKKKKFYLDNRYDWFRELPAEEKFQQYVNGVLECIKYHFKYESFKTGKKVDGTNVDQWDIALIADVLKHSKNLRMYDKFGALYGVKRLSLSYIEKRAAEDLIQETDITEEEKGHYEPFTAKLLKRLNLAAAPMPMPEGEEVLIIDDGVENIIMNPYTKKPAQRGEYVRVLAMPQFINHYSSQQLYKPIVSTEGHDVYFQIRHDVPIRRVIEAIMKKTWADILTEADYQRLRDCNYQWNAPRETLFV